MRKVLSNHDLTQAIPAQSCYLEQVNWETGTTVFYPWCIMPLVPPVYGTTVCVWHVKRKEVKND